MSELLPCPFCGGEARMRYISQLWEPKENYWAACNSCQMSGRHYHTEAEAIVAWNTRAYTNDEITLSGMYLGGLPIEDIRVFGMTLDEVRQMMKRDAERERTCRIVKTWSDSDYVDGWRYRCSECGCFIPVNERDLETGDVISAANYCPNCGAKVVGE